MFCVTATPHCTCAWLRPVLPCKCSPLAREHASAAVRPTMLPLTPHVPTHPHPSFSVQHSAAITRPQLKPHCAHLGAQVATLKSYMEQVEDSIARNQERMGEALAEPGNGPEPGTGPYSA